MPELRQTALELLAITDPQTKVDRVKQLFDEHQQQCIDLDTSNVLHSNGLTLPGRPLKPELVPPLTTVTGVCKLNVRLARLRPVPAE